MIKNTILLLGLGLVLFSCEKEDSDNVNQDRIHAVYELVYDKNDNQTVAYSYFTFGSLTGTPLEISSPSKVKFDGNDMEEKTLPRMHYETEQNGFHNTGDFYFKNADGNEFNNSVTYASLDFTVDTIQRNANHSLVWTGTALHQFEEVKVKLKSASNEYTYFSTTALNSHSISLPTSKLILLEAGQYSIQLVRTKNLILQEASSVGGGVFGTYKTLIKTVYLN